MVESYGTRPCYEQSISQQSQGLVAWEVLLDQDEQEDVPTATMQYATQRALEDLIAFTDSDNPDILYWDQAMRAHDRVKFIQAIGVKLDGHERMGNYEPIPIDKVPKGTKLIDMVWSMRCKDESRHKKCTNGKRGLMSTGDSRNMVFTTGTPMPQW